MDGSTVCLKNALIAFIVSKEITKPAFLKELFSKRIVFKMLNRSNFFVIDNDIKFIS